MALTKQHTSKPRTMSLGEHRDLDKIVTATAKQNVEQKRVNVNFDKDFHTRFKSACVNKGTTISDVIKELAEGWLKDNE